MGLEAIIAAIEANGAAALAQLEQKTAAQVETILSAAAQSAKERREAARRDAMKPAAVESARLLYQAEAEASSVTAAAHEELFNEVIAQTRRRLADLRQEPDYPEIWQRLANEAIQLLGEDECEGAILEIDPRDKKLAQGLADRGLVLQPVLACAGGVIARSSDGRIIITNTLESRLERALPLLRQEI
ncbi:MAG TPA: V-type ATP synthase subunit E family protein [Anaerolineae bacterium]